MKTALILIAVTLITLLGDYYIKIASGRPTGLFTRSFLIGAILYSLPAVGWFYLMKSHSLAVIGVFYSVSTIILLAALSFFVFKEPFGWREAVGVSLAVLAGVVISYK